MAVLFNTILLIRQTLLIVRETKSTHVSFLIPKEIGPHFALKAASHHNVRYISGEQVDIFRKAGLKFKLKEGFKTGERDEIGGYDLFFDY